MFQRLRRLQISLAAKCQILFGAAVVLIIGAALAVPWHRMEQLTEQLNQRSAGALAENVIAQHVQFQQARLIQGNVAISQSQPTTSQSSEGAEDLTLLSGATHATEIESSNATTQPLDPA